MYNDLIINAAFVRPHNAICMNGGRKRETDTEKDIEGKRRGERGRTETDRKTEKGQTEEEEKKKRVDRQQGGIEKDRVCVLEMV